MNGVSPFVAMLRSGLKIVENANLIMVVRWRTERPWCHRKRHKPEQAFKHHSKMGPDSTVYRMGNELYMHPHMAKRLRDALAARP